MPASLPSSLNIATARERIRAHADLNAFISLTYEEGDGPVVAVKDLVDVRGTVTTGGGIILESPPAEEDAPAVLRMREFGCVVVGKTNLHEWAFGVTSDNPHYGPVRNPHDPARVAGGSSGGSAVAVALGMCDWALGSDTGGSIRVPAAFCGVVGFKPTIGTVSTEDVIPLSRSLDTLGPLAADVRSTARALEEMSDLTDLVPAAPRPLSELRIARPKGWDAGLDDAVRQAWSRVAEGVAEVDFPDREEMGRPALTILYLEAAAYHRRWLETYPNKYGADVRRLLEQGLGVNRRDYVRAIQKQSEMRLAAEAAMTGWDALVCPASRIPPPLIGESYERADITGWTRPFNTTGHPVVCLPAPTSGLPVGVQVVGHFGDEARLVEVAMALEAAWAKPA